MKPIPKISGECLSTLKNKTEFTSSLIQNEKINKILIKQIDEIRLLP
ncbi:hypothetical protein SAMN06297358_3671 [Pedobacter xixiisoli]|uniref:Uncharacterized protein n=1 Tax=Pedobacter xixiisoli TaxID=1476464 RepID=A0A286ADJ9_9SPHI|nr:hypothetical protein SAMN06297358_3671 [Pedobacter xixiisoli]